MSATKSAPKAATKSTSRPEDFWASIDSRQKPSKTVSPDSMRPVIQHGYIRHEKGGSYLYCTDSYCLTALPIQMDCPSKQRRKLLPEVPLIPEALRSLDKSRSGRFRIKDGLVEVEGDRALYPVPTEQLNAPDFRALLERPGETDGLNEIGFNPRLLQRVSEALGATINSAGVKLSFVGQLREIKVESLNGAPGEGMVMPIRLNV